MTDTEHDTRSMELFADLGLYLTRAYIDVASECYLPDDRDRTDPRVSLLLEKIPDGLAPAYIATAGFDPLRDEGEAYARLLCDAGASVELRRFPDLIHGFFNVLGPSRRSRAAVAEMAVKLGAALA
jgi:acetyl esterase